MLFLLNTCMYALVKTNLFCHIFQGIDDSFAWVLGSPSGKQSVINHSGDINSAKLFGIATIHPACKRSVIVSQELSDQKKFVHSADAGLLCNKL